MSLDTAGNTVRCTSFRLYSQMIMEQERNVNWEGNATLTLRLLVSYIYMEYPFLMFLDHTQRRTTVGSTPLDE